MNTTITTLGNEVIIGLVGRLDTATSVEVGTTINNGLADLQVGCLTLDASQLEYISSSGLRILLLSESKIHTSHS